MPQLHVHNLPAHVPAEDLAGSTVIVIDMLRASSTICYALANGAKCVVPLLEIEETLELRRLREVTELTVKGHFALGISPL